jgi:hypothetical protein
VTIGVFLLFAFLTVQYGRRNRIFGGH